MYDHLHHTARLVIYSKDDGARCHALLNIVYMDYVQHAKNPCRLAMDIE
jgi:predicted fused transcriptional regulator/phosphomethylpyrimidine kinase